MSPPCSLSDNAVASVWVVTEMATMPSGIPLRERSEDSGMLLTFSGRYGDGMELSDEELESSMTVSGQAEPDTTDGNGTGSAKTDASQDTEPEETSGDE